MMCGVGNIVSSRIPRFNLLSKFADIFPSVKFRRWAWSTAFLRKGHSTSRNCTPVTHKYRRKRDTISLDKSSINSNETGAMHYTLAQAEATFVLTSASAGTQEAKAISAAARIATEVGNALIATADEAAAATAAAKSVAGAQALAAGASVLAGQVLTIAAAGAGKVFADANIAASLTASNDAADAVHTYVVASIGVNLIASTAATGFALLRENAAITAMTTAQKSAINATHTATLSNLADDLIGRNASEALDDPIAIAAAGNAAAAANKAAWETVRNLQARAAITFAGTGPGAGGFSMGFAGFTGWVGDQFDVVWAGFAGAGQGLAAAIDGIIPIYDPLSGLYDATDPTLQTSQSLGEFARNVTVHRLVFREKGELIRFR
jgi:hypothetical protein